MERPRISPVVQYGQLLQTIPVAIALGYLVWAQSANTTRAENTAATVTEIKPVVDANTKMNIEQGTQLAMLTATLTQLRADQAAIMSKLSIIGEDIAALKARNKQ